MTIDQVIKNVKNVCIKNNVSHLYLFGSFAKGTNRMGSDIDFVVKGVKDMRKLKDDLDNIKTLETINTFDYDNISNKGLIEEIDRYAKAIF